MSKTTKTPDVPETIAGQYLTLLPGEAESRIPSTNQGRPSHIALIEGIAHKIVPDDSREPGIGETLARQLLDDCKAALCDENAVVLPDRAPAPADKVPPPETDKEG